MSKYLYKVCCRLHSQGGEHYALRDDDHSKWGNAELEHQEYVIRKEVHNKKIKVDNETANEVFTRLKKEYGNCNKSENNIYSGDVIICRNAVLNDKKYTFEGTLYEFLNKVQGDAGCKLLTDIKPTMTEKGFYKTGGCTCEGEERYDDGGEVYQIHHLRGYKYPVEPIACPMKKFDEGGQPVREDEGLEQLKKEALTDAGIYGIDEGAEHFADDVIKKTAIQEEFRKSLLQRGRSFAYGAEEQTHYLGINLTDKQELIKFYNKVVKGHKATGQRMSNSELQKYIDTITFDELYNGAIIPEEFYKGYQSFLDTGKYPYQSDVIEHFIKEFNLQGDSESEKSKIGTVVYWVSQNIKKRDSEAHIAKMINDGWKILGQDELAQLYESKQIIITSPEIKGVSEFSVVKGSDDSYYLQNSRQKKSAYSPFMPNPLTRRFFKIKGQNETKQESSGQKLSNVETLNEFIPHPDLDASIYIEKIDPKRDKIEYEHGWQYKAKISYPESLGEQGNYEEGFVYKTYPSKEEQETDIRDTLEKERQNIIEGGKKAWGLEEIYSARDENILKAINKVLNKKSAKELSGQNVLKGKNQYNIKKFSTEEDASKFLHQKDLEGIAGGFISGNKEKGFTVEYWWGETGKESSEPKNAPPTPWLIKEKLNLFTDLLVPSNTVKEKAGVAIFYKDKILLTHPTGAGWKGTYSIPKGVMMQGETPIETAERELREETSIQLPERAMSQFKESQADIILKYREGGQVMGIPLGKMDKKDFQNWVGNENVKDGKIKVYRGTKVPNSKLKSGDFLTTNKEYAQTYGEYITEHEIPTNELNYFSGVKGGDAKQISSGIGHKAQPTELVYAPKDILKYREGGQATTDTFLTEGIKNISSNKSAMVLLENAFKRGMIPEHRYNEFGKRLSEIKGEHIVEDVATLIQDEFEKNITAPKDELQQEQEYDEINRIFKKENPTNEEVEFVNKNAFLPAGYEFSKEGLVKKEKLTNEEKDDMAHNERVNFETKLDNFTIMLKEGSPKFRYQIKFTKEMVSDFIKQREQTKFSNGAILNEIIQKYKLYGKEEDIKKEFAIAFVQGELPSKLFNKTNLIDADWMEGEMELKVRPIEPNIKVLKTPTLTDVSLSLKDIVYPAGDFFPQMQGVYHDAKNKVLVATDAHVLIKIPDKRIKKTELREVDNSGRLIAYDEQNKEKQLKFVNYEAVIDKDMPIKFKINIQEWLNITNGVARANKFFSSTERDLARISIKIIIGEQEFFFNPEYLNKVLAVFVKYGLTTADIKLNTSRRAMHIKSGEIFGMVMPVMEGELPYYLLHKQ